MNQINPIDINDANAHESYHKIWNEAAIAIDKLQNEISIQINELEKKYMDFEGVFQQIDERLKTLSSIYSGFNTIAGHEEIMRLISLLQSYKEKYTRESMDFNLINSLLSQISDLRNYSFEDFPAMDHFSNQKTSKTIRKRNNSLKKKPYRWITFQRRKSWFIAPYKTLDIRNADEGTVIESMGHDLYRIQFNDRIFEVKDLLSRVPGSNEKINYYLIINEGKLNLAASIIGKKIYSAEDLVNPLVEPFKSVGSRPDMPGRVRLFGNWHILISAQ